MGEAFMTRRRFFTLLAATATVPLVRETCAWRTAQAATWTGTALGADARLVFAGTPVRAADRHVAMALGEVERLEQIFSLYRADSELSVLNRDGRLDAPSPELRQVLHVARRVHRLSGGLFDPCVESVWRTRQSACEQKSVTQPFGDVRIDSEAIVLPEGSALTLNGIAQGYITDRVTDLMWRAGYRQALIDMGETRVLTEPASGGGDWRIALKGGSRQVSLAAGAIATSSSDTLMMCREKGIAHIIDPHTGATPQFWHAMTVRHPSATWADALSTALFLAPPERITRIAASIRGAHITAFSHDGSVQTWHGTAET